MIGIETATLPKTAPKDGVIYTRAWMVDLILDLAGYLPEKRLADVVALEPSAGDGAFLSGMVRRLVESCGINGIALENAAGALQAFEIDPKAAERAVGVVRATLKELEVPDELSEKLARNWIRVGDFLEASLCFPVADLNRDRCLTATSHPLEIFQCSRLTPGQETSQKKPLNQLLPTFVDFFPGSALVTEGARHSFLPVWSNDICAKKAAISGVGQNNRNLIPLVSKFHPDHLFS